MIFFARWTRGCRPSFGFWAGKRMAHRPGRGQWNLDKVIPVHEAPFLIKHTTMEHHHSFDIAVTSSTKWGTFHRWNGADGPCSPHLCVGFLFLVLYPAVRLLPATPVVPCPHHTQLVLTHNLLTHILSSHNLLTHTQLVITQLAHSHTSCSHTTYHLLTHNLSSHTSCHHTFTLRGRRGTW